MVVKLIMVVSKPMHCIQDVCQKLLISYFENLHTHPYRTKAFTRLTFGWSGPHLLFSWLESAIPRKQNFSLLKRFAFERLVYTPFFQFLVLFTLSIYEGKSYQVSLKNAQTLYCKVLQANLKYLSLLQFMNLAYVPPMLRVLFSNMIGFVWILFLSHQRKQSQEKTPRIRN
nr:PREDICTED: peroxisomal membrane protein 2 isoform X3 [Bemisia tabaci]